MFEHIEALADRDAVIKAFVELYRKQAQELPVEDWASYEERLRAAYPIHPELFDQLYQQWASLENFQLTRGVLRLMAAVISALWEQQDPSLLIMPSSVPVGHPEVLSHLKQYLEDPWVGVIAADVDGPNSAATLLDRANPNLGRLSATRRVARAVFLATAPTAGGPNPGVDDRRIKLGCVQPGEPPAIFGDALRRLAQEATHLYADKGRYWLDTKPTVTKTANQRAAQLSLEDDVFPEIVQRLRAAGRERGDFAAVHVAPGSPGDVHDEDKACLVILGPEHPHASGEVGSPARHLAEEILEARGTGPRRNRNMLLFLAVDWTRLEDLERAVRQYLAWRSVNDDCDALNLDAFQRSQAEQKLNEADEIVTQRIPEAYCWLLVPGQPDPTGPVEWQQFRVQSQDALAVRASRKLKTDELLLTEMGPVRLRLELDRVPLWQGDHVGVRQLWEYFAQYLYLPRLRDGGVLAAAIQEGVASTTWDPETFAYAEAFDESVSEYHGLRAAEVVTVLFDGRAVLVKPEVAAERISNVESPGTGTGAGTRQTEGTDASLDDDTAVLPEEPLVRRFHGAVSLDPLRVNKDVADVVEHVLQHLTALPGAAVEVTLEISAELSGGVPDDVLRIVTENARTLKFQDYGFERE